MIVFRPTPELLACLDEASDHRRRDATIEALLWQTSKIKAAAAKLGVEKPVRRKPGRPRKPA